MRPLLPGTLQHACSLYVSPCSATAPPPPTTPVCPALFACAPLAHTDTSGVAFAAETAPRASTHPALSCRWAPPPPRACTPHFCSPPPLMIRQATGQHPHRSLAGPPRPHVCEMKRCMRDSSLGHVIRERQSDTLRRCCGWGGARCLLIAALTGSCRSSGGSGVDPARMEGGDPSTRCGASSSSVHHLLLHTLLHSSVAPLSGRLNLLCQLCCECVQSDPCSALPAAKPQLHRCTAVQQSCLSQRWDLGGVHLPWRKMKNKSRRYI